MSISKYIKISHGKDDFSPDQLDQIAVQVKKRQHVLNFALKNLNQTLDHMNRTLKLPTEASIEAKATPANKLMIRKKSLKPVKTKAKPAKRRSEAKVIQGKVSYKVKGPGGKLMNIAEIKKWVDSFYDGEQGMVKQ